MIISKQLKERFVRDCRIPIKLFAEPYFNERIQSFDKYFGTVAKWEQFVSTLEKYSSEEEYFAAYNKVKDDAINFIKDNPAYEAFNTMDMQPYAIENINFPHKDIYHATNIGRTFASIDMKKANFSSMHYYDPAIFGGAETWEDFLRMFTDNEYIIQSKYIREVILGNCNPKRHITYEKYLMDQVLKDLKVHGIAPSEIVYFSNDEIVVDITDLLDHNWKEVITGVIDRAVIPLRLEVFKLRGIKDNKEIVGYIREMTDGSVDFKCLTNLNYPYVLRALDNEAITDSDLVFEYEGKLAKFLIEPNITIIDTFN